MGKRNHTVDALRALAALWVCWFHFTAATGIGAYGLPGA
jgi:peptidoglycan/LPS O-acetylase OafA/YrhL